MFNTRWNNSVRTSLTWMTRTEKKIIKEKRETEFVHEKTKVKTRIRKRETRKSDRETLKMHTRFSELIWRRNEEGKSMNSVNVIRLIIEESNRSSTTRRCIEFCMFQIENSLPTWRTNKKKQNVNCWSMAIIVGRFNNEFSVERANQHFHGKVKTKETEKTTIGFLFWVRLN